MQYFLLINLLLSKSFFYFYQQFGRTLKLFECNFDTVFQYGIKSMSISGLHISVQATAIKAEKLKLFVISFLLCRLILRFRLTQLAPLIDVTTARYINYNYTQTPTIMVRSNSRNLSNLHFTSNDILALKYVLRGESKRHVL